MIIQLTPSMVYPEFFTSCWNPSSKSFQFADDTVACTLQRLFQNACYIHSRQTQGDSNHFFKISNIYIVCQVSKKTITFCKCTASLLLCLIPVSIGNRFGGLWLDHRGLQGYLPAVNNMELFTYVQSSFFFINECEDFNPWLVSDSTDSKIRNSMPLTRRDNPLHSYAYS